MGIFSGQHVSPNGERKPLYAMDSADWTRAACDEADEADGAEDVDRVLAAVGRGQIYAQLALVAKIGELDESREENAAVAGHRRGFLAAIAVVDAGLALTDGVAVERAAEMSAADEVKP